MSFFDPGNWDFSVCGGLKLDAGPARKELKEFEKDTKTTTRRTASLFERMGASVGGVLNTMTGMLARDLVQGTAAVLQESLDLGIQYEQLSIGFEGLTRGVDEQVLSMQTLREATHGLVSNVDLMASANKAMALGLPTEDLNEYFEVASKLAPVLGLDVAQAVESLTMGIARHSKPLLDNLGIVIDIEDAYEEYAESIGKTADELSAMEQTMAVSNATMREANRIVEGLGDTTDTAGAHIQRWNTSWENLKTSIGVGLGATVGAVDELAGAFVIPAQESHQAITLLNEDMWDLASQAGLSFDEIAMDAGEWRDRLGEAVLGAGYYMERLEVVVEDVTGDVSDDFEDMSIDVDQYLQDMTRDAFYATDKINWYFERMGEEIPDALQKAVEALSRLSLREQVEGWEDEWAQLALEAADVFELGKGRGEEEETREISTRIRAPTWTASEIATSAGAYTPRMQQNFRTFDVKIEMPVDKIDTDDPAQIKKVVNKMYDELMRKIEKKQRRG